MQFETLETEIREFLRTEPIPCPSRKLDDWSAEKLGLGEKHRKALATAISRCGEFANTLKQFAGTHPDYGDLLKALLERKNALLRELERFQVDMLSPIQKSFFAGDAKQLQEVTKSRGGRKFQAPRRPEGRMPPHLRE